MVEPPARSPPHPAAQLTPSGPDRQTTTREEHRTEPGAPAQPIILQRGARLRRMAHQVIIHSQ